MRPLPDLRPSAAPPSSLAPTAPVTGHHRGPARFVLAGLAVLAWEVAGALEITAWDRSGNLSWTNAPVPGVCSIEVASRVDGPWTPAGNVFATTATGSLRVAASTGSSFRRVRAVDVSPTPAGFTNLVASYGLLETLAGNGAGQTDGVSYWQTWFEGWPGTWASLSRPHCALADAAGNVYIADKNSHSVLRVAASDGTIATHAGTHTGGFDGEGPAPSTNLQLNQPNGLWVRSDGTVYILDTGNGRVRRVSTNGVMQTLFLATGDGSSLAGGRGLWVNDTETLAYFCAGTRVRSWGPSAGLRTVASGFTELGTLFVESDGRLVVCDRGAHRVYRLTPTGTRTVLAGNGTTSGGGDGQSGLATGLNGVRSVWPVPTGGYLLLTHDGCQLWYLDAGGTIHLLLHGAGGRTHAGDGLPFYSPEPKISEGRSIAMDAQGHILICESDYGYVRRIRFERLAP